MGVDARRVAEVIVERCDGSIARGSGYLVGTGRVLTARHVLDTAISVRVRFNGDRPDERTEDAAVLWPETAAADDSDGDLAVLAVPTHHKVAPASFGRIAESGGQVPCETVGFPLFKMRDYPDGQGRYRDSHHARGHISPLSNRREGTWELVVSAPPRAPEPEECHSPWSGMSGAAVWVGDYIVGMVSRHHSTDGLRMLAAVRADTWAARVGSPARRARLEQLLGTRMSASDLPRADAAIDPDPPSPVRVVVGTPSAATSIRPVAEWRAGDKVPVGRQSYLLFADDLANSFVDRPPSRVRRARALRVSPADGPGSAYVWLRQIEMTHEGAREATYDTTAREREGIPGRLHREYEALRAASSVPGALRPEAFVRTGRTETLALAWPTTATGGPCPTLRDRYGPNLARLDPWRFARFAAAMAALCGTFAALHARGVTHRALAPETLIVGGDGTLMLRDLGLAMQPPRRGEAFGTYEAPEQRRSVRGAGPPGAATDVHQLAAITYHLVTGEAPMQGRPLPVAALAAHAPPSLAEALDAALRPEPELRPTARALGAALSAARAELSRGQPR